MAHVLSKGPPPGSFKDYCQVPTSQNKSKEKHGGEKSKAEELEEGTIVSMIRKGLKVLLHFSFQLLVHEWWLRSLTKPAKVEVGGIRTDIAGVNTLPDWILLATAFWKILTPKRPSKIFNNLVLVSKESVFSNVTVK